MTASEQFHHNSKTFVDQLAQIDRHIREQKIYTSFDFAKLTSQLAQYQVWSQANTGVIEAALRHENKKPA